MSKEDFKKFISDKPYLTDYVENGEMTWQRFYELYDIYGDKDEIWNKYKKKNDISNYITNLNLDIIESGLEKVSKTLDILSEISSKDEKTANNIKPTEMKNINKLFGD